MSTPKEKTIPKEKKHQISFAKETIQVPIVIFSALFILQCLYAFTIHRGIIAVLSLIVYLCASMMSYDLVAKTSTVIMVKLLVDLMV